MFSSPAKRRRISTIDSAMVNDSKPGTPGRSNPATPTRASYLSPTKASLARSHPHLISRAQRKSLTEPRGRKLQDESTTRMMPDEANDVHGLGTQTHTIQQQNPDSSTPQENTSTQESSGGNKNAASHEPLVVPHSSVPRSPLTDREPNTTNQNQSFRPRNEQGQPQLILPKLVKRIPSSAQSRSRQGSKEPDLPPTPVQLGIGPVPERPRGLGSSSSPRGSKSGSGRNRKRTRDKIMMSSSPLKPRNKAILIDETEDAESQQDSAQEAPESEAEERLEKAFATDSEEVKKKQEILRDLWAELEAVKRENEILETTIGNGEESNKENINQNVFSILEKAIPATSIQLPPLSAVQTSPGAMFYHSLFAPGNLQLSVRTATRKIQQRLKAIHTLTIIAPPPWTRQTFSADFAVVTDAANAQVERVYRKDLKAGSRRSAAVYPELSRWIEHRWDSPLHKLDIGGVIWGAGKYFDECVRRAKILQKLDIRYNQGIVVGDDFKEDGVLTEEHALDLMKYLQMSQMDFKVSGDLQDVTRLLFVWQIELTWSGGLMSTVEVIPSGVSESAQSEIRTVFDTLASKGDIVTAFEGAYNLLRGEKVVSATGGGKAAKGKRKRF